MEWFLFFFSTSMLWMICIGVLYGVLFIIISNNPTEAYYLYENIRKSFKNFKSYIDGILRKYLPKKVYKIVCIIIFYTYTILRNFFYNLDQFITIYIGDFNKVLNFIFFSWDTFLKIVKVLLWIILIIIIILIFMP